MDDICGDMATAPKVRLSTKKLLKGHINKVNSVHFSGDSRLVSTRTESFLQPQSLIYMYMITLSVP
jgi:hypothetical protein